MSENEHHKGKLKIIEIPEYSDTFEKQVNYLKGEGYSFSYVEIETKYIESDDCYHINNIWYKIIEHENALDNGDIRNAKRLDNNEIAFELRFYNGGCGFNEALEQALGILKNEEDRENLKKGNTG